MKMPSVKFWLSASFILLQASFVLNQRVLRSETWTGRWFPEEPTTPKPNIVKVVSDRVPMGVYNASCDDGKTNLTLDWDGSFEDFTCLNPRSRYIPDESIDSLLEFENVPKAYVAPHFCMDKEIKYFQRLPTFGAHRPLWPKYGEYKFVPKQRWLHTLEHGGIVALYHPCADLREIFLLKKLVKNCLRRHVISPSNELSEKRPLAILAWGARLTMPAVYPNAVRQFIRERALRGPEKLPDEGQFDSHLMEPAAIVSDFEDSKICPDM